MKLSRLIHFIYLFKNQLLASLIFPIVLFVFGLYFISSSLILIIPFWKGKLLAHSTFRKRLYGKCEIIPSKVISKAMLYSDFKLCYIHIKNTVRWCFENYHWYRNCLMRDYFFKTRSRHIHSIVYINVMWKDLMWNWNKIMLFLGENRSNGFHFFL